MHTILQEHVCSAPCEPVLRSDMAPKVQACAVGALSAGLDFSSYVSQRHAKAKNLEAEQVLLGHSPQADPCRRKELNRPTEYLHA